MEHIKHKGTRLVPQTLIHQDRAYLGFKFKSDKDANDFLEENPEFGVLRTVRNNVYVARNDDEGLSLDMARLTERLTSEVHEWMKRLHDDDKMRFAINWKMPHTLFNVACQLRPAEELQGVDWFKIYESHDLGVWSHGGGVMI